MLDKNRRPVVLVHGLFLTYRSWDGWKERYEERGYECLTPAWPGRTRPVVDLRESPDPDLGSRTFDDVIESLATVIHSLPQKPIIMGHSLGGLLAQMLIHRGLGAAGVAIDSGAPQGIFTTNPSFVIGNWAAINPLNSSSEAYLMPFEHFQYAFVNGRPVEEQRRAYDEQVVPESLRIARGALTLSAHVDFSKPHAPLLFIAGTSDHIVPAALNRTNYDHYKRGSDSIVDFQEFGGRNHYGVVAGHDWELVADAAIEWAERRIAETSEAR